MAHNRRRFARISQPVDFYATVSETPSFSSSLWFRRWCFVAGEKDGRWIFQRNHIQRHTSQISDHSVVGSCKSHRKPIAFQANIRTPAVNMSKTREGKVSTTSTNRDRTVYFTNLTVIRF